MKKKNYSTTEFYKKPSEALSFVKDGGVVFLGYKKLKEPIAVISTYKDYMERIENESEKEISLWEKVKDKVISAKEIKDSATYFRRKRDEE